MFAAINDVRGWWSGDIDGATDQLGAEFTYRYEDVHYSKQRIMDFVPGEKVTWLILDSYLSFAADKGEWNGTTVTFHIAKQGDQTQVRVPRSRHLPAPTVRMIFQFASTPTKANWAAACRGHATSCSSGTTSGRDRT